MAKKQPMGFGQSITTPTKKKKNLLKAPEDAVLYSHDFDGIIPGDVCISLEKALLALSLNFEEVSTITISPMGGPPIETPFVRYSTEDNVEIPYGTFRVEGLGDISLSQHRYSATTLSIRGLLNSSDCKTVWRSLIAKVNELGMSESIFRNRAFQVNSPQDLIVPLALPLDQDLTVIFNPEVEKTLNTCVLWPLKNRLKAKKAGIRLRRGAILDGYYGCGKSLFLYKAAKVAFENGWTVVNITPGMISVAAMVAPVLGDCCLIVEDVDAGAHGDRDRLNGILNSLSSVSTKCSGDYMLLVSTNFLERIDPALLRPERIDALVRVTLPEDGTIVKLVHCFANGRLPKTVKLPLITEALKGCTPAIIGEVVQRSLIETEMLGLKHITESMLLSHVASMVDQKRMALPEFRTGSDGDQLAESLQKVIG